MWYIHMDYYSALEKRKLPFVTRWRDKGSIENIFSFTVSYVRKTDFFFFLCALGKIRECVYSQVGGYRQSLTHTPKGNDFDKVPLEENKIGSQVTEDRSQRNE